MNPRTSQKGQIFSKSLFLIATVFTYSTLKAQVNPTDFFTKSEIDAANTAKGVDYLTQDERDIFLFNNLARMQPQKFHSFYVAYCKDQGSEGYIKSDFYYRTLSEDLKKRAPAGAMLPDRKMFELAECWAVESGELGIIGHDRVKCEGGYGGENCAYGNSGGLDIVMQLLIDSGVESLGHRKNMLNSGWKGMGTAIRPHAGYRVCAVQNFTWTNDVLRAEAEQKRIAAEKAAAERARKLAERAKKFESLINQFTTSEKAQADAARSLGFLTTYEKDFYFYYNLARLYPAKFKKLIWDEGPYFDRFRTEQDDLRSESGFGRFEKHLKSTSPKPAFIPNKKYMDAGRCVVRKWRANGNSTECLPGPGAWSLQTFYSEGTYNDFLSIVMTDKEFDHLFNKNAHMAVIEGDDQAVKVFLR